MGDCRMSEPVWQTLDRVTAKHKELCDRIADLERQNAELRKELAEFHDERQVMPLTDEQIKDACAVTYLSDFRGDHEKYDIAIGQAVLHAACKQERVMNSVMLTNKTTKEQK